MSEGPIKRERDARTLPRVVVSNAARLCARKGVAIMGSACGRRKHTIAPSAEQVNCRECLAAVRADHESTESRNEGATS